MSTGAFVTCHSGVNIQGSATEQGNENLPNLKVASIHFIVHALTQ